MAVRQGCCGAPHLSAVLDERIRSYRGMMIPVVLLVLAATAQEPFRSQAELQAWLTYYYLRPRPELTIPSLDFMERELQKAKGGSLADEVSRGGMGTFYAKILEQNP